MAYISYISGPVIRAGLEGERPKLWEVVYVGKKGLVGEIVELKQDEVVIQVYENTEGLRLKEPVSFTGRMLSTELGPGLIGNIFDGIQRPLSRLKERIERGIKVKPLDRKKKWEFRPLLKIGDYIEEGDIIGEIIERGIVHRIIYRRKEDKVRFIADEGEYTVEKTILITEKGYKQKLYIESPVRIPLRIKRREKPEIPLITGQRIIDFLFPVSKGGTAAIPGGFGTGKTVLQQTLAKWSDADIIVYIGCGERGNEMTEVLEEFPRLKDPKTGRNLIDRTVLVANTSDMPVSARESSIYMGITIAEYYRDMGYSVAIFADSTSRWAEAMREISSRLNEIPVEEGFPAYLSSRIGSVYERAGYVRTISGREGSMTIIGAVSPPGGDFSEPVTRHTKKYTGTFWALDKDLANARIYPAINYNLSYSFYVGTVKKWWNKRFPDWEELRNWMIDILQEDSKLQRIVKLLGIEAIPEEQKLTVMVAELIKEFFLQQNAFDPVDTYSSPERQIKMARVLKKIHQMWKRAYYEKKIPVSVLRSQPVISEVMKSKYEITDKDIEYYDKLLKKIEDEYESLIYTYGE